MMQEKAMSSFGREQRFKIALGGFLSFLGIIVLILTFLVITRTMDFENILHSDLVVGAIAVMGILDILAGILLLRSK